MGYSLDRNGAVPSGPPLLHLPVNGSPACCPVLVHHEALGRLREQPARVPDHLRRGHGGRRRFLHPHSSRQRVRRMDPGTSGVGGSLFAPDLTAGLCTVAVPGVGDLSVAAKLGGPGNMSHLGRVTFEATVDCATFAVGTNSSGAVWLLADGTGKWTAANGDYFTFTYLGTISLVPIPGIIAFGPITIDGGSGRFEDATGNASGSGTIDFATGSGVFSIEGWITYGAYNRSNR